MVMRIIAWMVIVFRMIVTVIMIAKLVAQIMSELMQIAHVHAYTQKGAEQKHDAQRMEHEGEATLIG
jgi:hypothetical protein